MQAQARRRRREGDVPTAGWVVTRASCDGDNSDAVRGRGGAILGASGGAVFILGKMARSELYLDTRPRLRRTMLHSTGPQGLVGHQITSFS